MLVAMYLVTPDTTQRCAREDCDRIAHYIAVAVDAAMVEHLCWRHCAQHMRGNAYALDPDTEPEAIEAQLQNELDRFG